MMEYSHSLLVRGRYQIVALTDQAQFNPAEITGYAVLSPGGERLRYEPSFDSACLWAERLIEDETKRHGEKAMPRRTRRLQR